MAAGIALFLQGYLKLAFIDKPATKEYLAEECFLHIGFSLAKTGDKNNLLHSTKKIDIKL